MGDRGRGLRTEDGGRKTEDKVKHISTADYTDSADSDGNIQDGNIVIFFRFYANHELGFIRVVLLRLLRFFVAKDGADFIRIIKVRIMGEIVQE